MDIDLVSITPQLQLLYASCFEVGSTLEIGATHYGHRRIIPIYGGRFKGDRLAGEVLPGGADWQIIRQDGIVEVEARYTFKTHDGALIYVRNNGILRASTEIFAELVSRKQVDPSGYYFRTVPSFETGHESYQWLNQLVAVATAEVRPNQILITAYTVT